MTTKLPAMIDLTEEEKRLLGRISFDIKGLDDEAIIDCLKAAEELASALIERRAVPKARLEYFTDDDLDDARSKSPKAVFESNGTKGQEILRHPHFLPFLRYFIYGPDLPMSSLEGFCRIVEEDAGTTGMVMNQLCRFVRAEVRRKGMRRPKAADEFFKLAHELGIAPGVCRAIRDAARTTK